MVAVEKAGIPAVAIAAKSFARAWQACVDGWGQPSTAFVTIPHATTGQQADFIRKMVDEQIDAIIQGLTANFSLAFMTTVVGLPLAAVLRTLLVLTQARRIS